MLKSSLIFLILGSILMMANGDQPQTYVYKTIGNLNITLDVYTPEQSPYEKYPVFFCIHGGAYVAGAKTTAFSSLELSEMLSLGFVVVSIDYRLAPGALLSGIVQDVQDAYKWIRTELVKNVTVNPDQIVVFGRSAGGGLAVISGYMLSPRPKAIIAFYSGCTNFAESYVYNPNTPISPIVIAEANALRVPVIVEHFSSGNLDPRTVLFETAMLNGKGGWLLVSEDSNESPVTVTAKLRAYSAVDNVNQDYPPTYLAHGLNDTSVPYEQSVMLAQVLNATNIPYVLDLVPNANHDFDLGAKNTSDPLWEEHVLPAFEFAQYIVNKNLIPEFDIIS